jgi:V-type H+-transporting ATPase subunit a
MFGIVTFPFLFGVMFGDIGHGFLLFLFGVFLCLCAEKLRESAIGALVSARYLIVLMGVFSIFNGICYNDFMSIPLDISTCYDVQTRPDGTRVGKLTEDCVIAIGIDPTWFLATNVLTFVNGFKMKMAVIFGVVHMSLGIFMKAFNSLYFGHLVDFFFEFLPQIILLWSLFGFMNVLIVVKWLTPWAGRESESPSIIAIMINMFLSQGEVEEGMAPLLWSASTQQLISLILLLIAFITVPLMLLVKPFYLKWKHNPNHRSNSLGRRLLPQEEDENDLNENSEHTVEYLDDGRTTVQVSNKQEPVDLDEIVRLQGSGEENHAFGEIFIHQLIETIEFVLGTVSNTASYLRLWALSLAHSQLADVFFDKLLNDMGLEGPYFYMLFILFPVFFSFTLFVLMCMDSMECFLHTLRLHWVEFQNKFYKGNGYLFIPFSFESDLKKVK